jgi:hypothetical protein
MREQIFAIWVPYARRETGLSERELRPIVWMLNASAWALSDLVDDGTVGREEAIGMLAHVAERVMVRDQIPGRRRKAAARQPSGRKQAGKGDPDE